MNNQKQTILHILIDLISVVIVWVSFYYFRDVYIEHDTFITDLNFYKGTFFVSLFWMVFYVIQGTYRNVLRNYRLKTIFNTFIASFLGSIIIFLVLLLDDIENITSYKDYYTMLFVLFGLHFFITLIPRLILVTYQVKKIHKGEHGFNTLIIGGSEKAIEILDELEKLKQNSGHKITGYVNINGNDFLLSKKTEFLGHISDIHQIIKNKNIEEVIIALESSDHEKLKDIITQLSAFDLIINVVPDNYDILSGQVKMNSIFGALLIQVNQDNMPDWQHSTKRLIDIVASLIALIILSPLFLILAVLVKLSSKGPVFFKQERIGINGKPFNIIKFRTMYVGAEKNGPQLSSSDDKRITPLGKFLRKTRLDEFPQFWNVLKGDMSIVGPRPERQFYIDQISAKDPQYLYLHKVRPGITSWGQVKYGYAENVDEMVQRMKYDLLYIRNMSLSLDFKIMFYTIAIIIKAKGK
jgi:exopolysaccharide biosynthesis polyprenyl glycosylphosphotransferase